VAVYDYIWTEEEPGYAPPTATPITGSETSTHVSIYTLHLSGQRQHYRHFLRQPDGTIIEVSIFSDEILNRGSHRVEPLGGSVCDGINETST
ncbi:hypothetical protein DNTS_013463, partial [Danionella cerebrum]